MMRWPWVSRAEYEKVVAELEAERQRARRREKRNSPRAVEMIGTGEDAGVEVTATSTGFPSAIAKAIREVAGADRPLARHLRQFAAEQIAAEIPEREIVAAIRRGEEVAL